MYVCIKWWMMNWWMNGWIHVCMNNVWIHIMYGWGDVFFVCIRWICIWIDEWMDMSTEYSPICLPTACPPIFLLSHLHLQLSVDHPFICANINISIHMFIHTYISYIYSSIHHFIHSHSTFIIHAIPIAVHPYIHTYIHAYNTHIYPPIHLSIYIHTHIIHT